MSDRLTFYDSAAVETGRRDDLGRPEFRKAITHDQAIELAANGLLSACYQFWPDVVLIVSGFFVPGRVLEVMRARRHKLVMVNTECPYEDSVQVDRSAMCDVALVNDPVSLDRFRGVCPVAEYVPHAYRPSVHFPAPPGWRPDFDLAFSGTAYQSRIGFFEGMGLKGLKVALAGNWLLAAPESPLRKYLVHDVGDCMDNTATADLYRVSRAGINFYRREGEDGMPAGVACGPREIEMAACGLWFLRDPRPESDELFPSLPSFTDAQQAGELLRWGLRNDTVREQGAQAAREAVADRTFSSNAKMLLRLLDRQPVTL